MKLAASFDIRSPAGKVNVVSNGLVHVLVGLMNVFSYLRTTLSVHGTLRVEALQSIVYLFLFNISVPELFLYIEFGAKLSFASPFLSSVFCRGQDAKPIKSPLFVLLKAKPIVGI